jgi:hypothetical protein
MNKDIVDLVESLGGTVLFDGALIQFTDTTFMAALKKIYESGALEEREACAALCFDIWNKWLDSPEEDRHKMLYDAEDCADAIRARGKHD